MKTGLIFAGGPLSAEFAGEVYRLLGGAEKCFTAAADAGLSVCDAAGIRPELLLGDFDSLKTEILERYLPCTETERHSPVKDASDLELTVTALAERGIRDMAVLGALGGRADHMLSNLRMTLWGRLRGLRITLLDPQNRIRCLIPEDCPFLLSRERQWGKYVSFFPAGGEIRDLTLRGFRYPLTDRTLCLQDSPSLTVSNELAEAEGEIRFAADPGAGLLVMESRDGGR